MYFSKLVYDMIPLQDIGLNQPYCFSHLYANMMNNLLSNNQELMSKLFESSNSVDILLNELSNDAFFGYSAPKYVFRLVHYVLVMRVSLVSYGQFPFMPNSPYKMQNVYCPFQSNQDNLVSFPYYFQKKQSYSITVAVDISSIPEDLYDINDHYIKLVFQTYPHSGQYTSAFSVTINQGEYTIPFEFDEKKNNYICILPLKYFKKKHLALPVKHSTPSAMNSIPIENQAKDESTMTTFQFNIFSEDDDICVNILRVYISPLNPLQLQLINVIHYYIEKHINDWIVQNSNYTPIPFVCSFHSPHPY